VRHVGPRAAARHRAPPPEERSLTEPQYVGSFPRADAPLDPPLPEIAFVGRSNVGKSTLLNALVGRRIAKVSGTPGKTRAFNVFRIGDSHYFLDLPGYGYARAGKAQRATFRGLVKHALQRERLSGVVWLLDIRHPPSADDRAIQEVLVEDETRVLAALTKGDKLTPSKRRTRERELRDDLGLPEDQLIVTSAKTGEGIADLREAIAGLIQSQGAS
jgi:GTP-binding protein